jgi:hypothetical protein
MTPSNSLFFAWLIVIARMTPDGRSGRNARREWEKAA